MNSAMFLRSPALAGGGGVRVRLYSVPAPTQFARGGLAKAAEMTRAAGRGDDEVLLHITPEEFEALKAQWGEPTINPRTGLPEYGFLSKAWKKVKKTFKKIAPYVGLVTSVFFPALAPAIGTMMGAGSAAAASALGNAVISGVAGGATGGAKGALAGAVTGGLGSYSGKIGEYAGLKGNAARIAGSAALGGVGSKIQGGDFASGALQGGLNAYMQPTLNRMGETVRDSQLGKRLGMTPVLREVEVTPRPMGSGASAPTAPDAGQPGTAPPTSGTAPSAGGAKGSGDLIDLASKYLPVAMLAGGIGGSGKGQQAEGPPPLPPDFTRPLQQIPFNRSHVANSTDWYTYGMRPEQSFYQDNAIPEFDPNEEQPQQQAADGGAIYRRGGALSRARRFVSGPGTGRSDSIPAQLSDGEYVLTAEDVALIGDGSSKAGAQKLDAWRRELRKHKGRALARGKISPNAKSPMAYLRSAKNGLR